MTAQIAAISSLALFAAVFVTGFILRRSESPYGTGGLTVHKLLALAAAGLILWGVLIARKHVPLDGVMLASIMAAALFFAVAVATGGIISAQAEPFSAIRIMHKWAPWLCLVSVGAVIYMLATG